MTYFSASAHGEPFVLRVPGSVNEKGAIKEASGLMNESTIALSYLFDRGIGQETVAANKVEICTRVLASTYRLRLHFDNWHNGPFHEIVNESIWFPCMDAHSTIHNWIVRPFPVLLGKDGNAVKFLTSKDGNGYPFVPLKTWEVKGKPNKPLLITEGPCKGLSALQAGAFPIAVNGVWMATSNKAGSTQLHQALLDGFIFRGRTVFLGFDADFATNPSVMQALIRTFILTHKAGAEVKILSWPAAAGKGLDDYLVNTPNGSKALESLCEKAVTIDKVVRGCHLEFIEMELTNARLRVSVLAQLSRLFAPALKIPASTLEETIKIQYAEEKQELGMAAAEPWPEEVSGEALANDLLEVVKSYVVLDEKLAYALVLWIFLTYLEADVECLPLLSILSPVKRCGKTMLLALLTRLVHKPLASSNTSTAAIYRVIQQCRPTLIIDEVDTWLKDNEDARGVINSGHTRDTAYVLRCNSDSNEPERFSTWPPKALAGIGKLADTLTDRSIAIKLERRKQTQKISKLRDAPHNTFSDLRKKLVRWTLDNHEDIAEARPRIPDALNDREGDNWSPLLAIANQLNGAWPSAALKTALSMSDSDDEETINILLISAIKEILHDTPNEKDFIPTCDLIKALNEEKGHPWSDWAEGKGITETRLARNLKDFGIKPERKWNGVKKVMCYDKGAFRLPLNVTFAPNPLLTLLTLPLICKTFNMSNLDWQLVEKAILPITG